MSIQNDKILAAQTKVYSHLVRRQRVTQQIADSQSLSESMSAIIPDATRASKDDVAVAEAAALVLNLHFLAVAEPGLPIKCGNNNESFVAYSEYLCVTNPWDAALISSAQSWARRESIEFKHIGVISPSYLSELRSLHAGNDDEDGAKLDEKRALQQAETIFRQAAHMDASDVHFVTNQSEKVDVKFRIDGVLRAQKKIDFKLYESMVRAVLESRCNVQFKSNEDLDGKYELALNSDKSVDLRISTIPVARRSETTVKLELRILGKDKSLVDLERLDMSKANYDRMIRFGNYPNGMIIMTGPTGSGKTTTLAAQLISMQSRNPNRNFHTLENPVEMQHEGMSHTEITPILTFAKGLRSLLRQDPDVILLGEMRDTETAGLAYEAAMTGHLVLSTLHTNSAHESIGRLIRMGVDIEIIATNTTAFMAQRLVRRLCPSCKIEYRLKDDPAQFAMYGRDPAFSKNHGETILYKANKAGCKSCGFASGGGEKGRQSVMEILEMTADVQVSILNGLNPALLRRRQIADGTFDDMWTDGLRLVAEGKVGIEQLEPELKPYFIDRVELHAALGGGRPTLVPVQSRPQPSSNHETGLVSL
jgi:type II secretory ATPase GspE/PulE/Tfp pilus assembly ATPase PilB-like protein